jgi:CBS domain-containing protein
METLVAKDIMTSKVISVKKESTIEHLIRILIKYGISGVPVVDLENNIVGVVTEADIIIRESDLPFPLSFGFAFYKNYENFLKNNQEYLQTKVEDIMTKKIKTVEENTPLSKIVNIMINNNINRLPVVDKNNKLTGLIARSDILKSMLGKE